MATVRESSFEGGAGGKLRIRPLRKSGSPYDRPSIAIRKSWKAGWLEAMHEWPDKSPTEAISNSSSGAKERVSNGGDQLHNNSDSIEHRQKKFTRAELDDWAALVRSRTVDQVSEDKMKMDGSRTSKLATTRGRNRSSPVHRTPYCTSLTMLLTRKGWKYEDIMKLQMEMYHKANPEMASSADVIPMLHISQEIQGLPPNQRASAEMEESVENDFGEWYFKNYGT